MIWTGYFSLMLESKIILYLNGEVASQWMLFEYWNTMSTVFPNPSIWNYSFVNRTRQRAFLVRFPIILLIKVFVVNGNIKIHLLLSKRHDIQFRAGPFLSLWNCVDASRLELFLNFDQQIFSEERQCLWNNIFLRKIWSVCFYISILNKRLFLAGKSRLNELRTIPTIDQTNLLYQRIIWNNSGT